jgi:dTDP-4-dehydrorhamnose 3,5-epimerase
MIQGVFFKDLITHADERGFFREILRKEDQIFKEGMGQISHSIVYQGVIKAWHYHRKQTQWNYVVNGLIKVALHDLRDNSPTYRETMNFLIGDYQVARLYCFPSGVAHGYKCLKGPMNIIYLTSGIYDLSDEGRIPFDDPKIGYDWSNIPFIK